MPKKNTAQPKKKFQQNLIRKLIFSLIVLALIVTTIVQGVRIDHLEKENLARNNEQVAQTLLQSVNDLNQPLPIEASTGKVFLANQHLSLPPAPAPLGQLVYSTAYANDDNQFPVQIAAKNDIEHASQSINSTQQDSQKVFQALPTVQACARGVGISFTKDDKPAAAEKKLGNGKTLYFYTESLCTNKALLEYVKQVDSY
jgi:hypothetical protein